MSWRPSLVPLRNRSFRFLVAGQLASNFGDAFYAVALPWYVLADHGGPLLLAGVLSAYGIPRTVAMAVGGHASDRWRPWTVMMVADWVRAFAVVVLALAALSGPARASLLIPIAAVIGAGEGLFLPGSFSIIPLLLSEADLQSGNAVASSGTQLATLVGPAIGGGLVAWAGPAPAFAVDAASFVVSAASLAGVKTASSTAQRSKSASAQPPEGTATDGSPDQDAYVPGQALPAPTLRYLLRSQPVLRVILVVILAANLGSGGLAEVALPELAHGPLHAGAAGYGALVASLGGGALVGTLVASQIRRVRRPAVVASLGFLAAAIFVSLAPYLGSTIAAGAALAIFGGLNAFSDVVIITAFQRWAPPKLLGRLMGLILLPGFGIFPVSVALGGVVVRDFGAAPFFPASGGVLVLAILAGLTQKSWRALGQAAE